jgi:hypothetical protein
MMTADTPRPRARRLWLLVTGVPFLITVGVLVLLAVAYTLAGFFLLPRLIATHVPRYAQEQLKRRAEIGEVRVNPLLFKVDIRTFAFRRPTDAPSSASTASSSTSSSRACSGGRGPSQRSGWTRHAWTWSWARMAD